MTRIRNRGAAALLLLAAALALLLSGDGGVVQAQTFSTRWWVTGYDNDDSITSTFDDNDLAQKFTTGSNDLGYTLTQITLNLLLPKPQTIYPTVKIFSGSANGTEVATLNCPFNTPTETRTAYQCSAPVGTTLAKDTSYWVVVEGGSGTWYASAQRYTPAPGFSIADYRESRGKDTTGSFDQTMGAAWQIWALGFINAGAPAITAPNVFRVPAALGVDLSGITDQEGTTNIADNATYKWQRFDSTGTTLETDSIGTASTYTLTDADAGKTLKVVVNFTDDDNNSEGPLTSAATSAITAAASCNAPTLTGGATFLGGARKLGVGSLQRLLDAFTYYGFTNRAAPRGQQS